MADKAEVEEKIAQLERDATASHVLYVQSCNARDVAVNECKKAEALLEAAKIRLSAAEEARQKASANYSTARNRISTMKQTLKKAK